MDPIVASLGDFARPPSWLGAAADGARVADALRRLVPEFGDGRLLACDVEDVRLRDDRWIGRYVVTVRTADGAAKQTALTGVLVADKAILGEQTPRAAFGSTGWSVSLTDPPLTLSTAALDRKLTALPLLLDPATAPAWLENALAATFPGVRIAGCESVVARYRPGQRCTVICRLTYGEGADRTWPEVVVAKVHRKGEGARGHGALEALSAAVTAGSAGFVVARPLAYLPADDVSLQAYLPENRNLSELISRASAGIEVGVTDAVESVRAVATALAALHRAPVRYGPVSVLGDEVESVRSHARKLGAVFPELAVAIEPLVGLIEQCAIDVPADAARPSHGAFRPAQVRLSGDRVGFLDLDGFGECEPAQDLGRFVGRLRLLALGTSSDPEPPVPARLDLGNRLVAAFLDAYGEEATVSPVRVTLWESLDLLKTLQQSWSRVRVKQIAPVLPLLERRVTELRAAQHPPGGGEIPTAGD